MKQRIIFLDLCDLTVACDLSLESAKSAVKRFIFFYSNFCHDFVSLPSQHENYIGNQNTLFDIIHAVFRRVKIKSQKNQWRKEMLRHKINRKHKNDKKEKSQWLRMKDILRRRIREMAFSACFPKFLTGKSWKNCNHCLRNRFLCWNGWPLRF